MADHPCPFHAPLIRALQAGQKSQTRRPMSDRVSISTYQGRPVVQDRDGVYRTPPTRYKVSDWLWVREAWRVEARYDHVPPRDIPVGSLVSYEADYDQEPNDGCRGRLRAGMFMPRWASRMTLAITAVRVERLQDISEADVWAEGVEIFPGPPGYAQSEYAALWDRIHGAGAWAANPWVAAYAFTVEARNIGAEAAHA